MRYTLETFEREHIKRVGTKESNEHKTWVSLGPKKRKRKSSGLFYH